MQEESLQTIHKRRNRGIRIGGRRKNAKNKLQTQSNQSQTHRGSKANHGMRTLRGALPTNTGTHKFWEFVREIVKCEARGKEGHTPHDIVHPPLTILPLDTKSYLLNPEGILVALGRMLIRRPPRLLTGSLAPKQSPRCRHAPSVPNLPASGPPPGF